MTTDVSEFLNAALDALSNKDYSSALEEYKKALELNENNIEALKGAGLCTFNLKNNEMAIEYFQKAIEITPDDATSLYYLGSLSVLTERTEDAIAYAKKVIELRPDYFDAYKILFTLYLKNQRHTEMIELQKEFEQNNVQSINDDTVHLVIGTMYMSKKQYKEAIEFLKAAHKISPKKEQILNNLGMCYMALKDYDAAINAFNKAIELNPNYHLTYANLATTYQVKGELLLALETYNKALELAPDNLLHLMNVANLSNLLRKYDITIASYEQILKLNPELKEIQSSLIGAYVKNKEHKKAINLIDVALKKTPRNVPLLFRKAKIYTDLNDFVAAKKIYEQILAFKKNSPTIYQAFAILHTKMNDYDNALKYLNKCLTLDNNNAQAHKDMGIIYTLRNQIEYAKDEFELAEKLGYTDNEILKECADFHYSISEFDKAEELYKKSLKLENNPYTSLSFGINYIAQNRLDEAFAILEPLLGVLPEDAELLYNLARIFYAKGEFDQASRLAKKAYFKVPTVEIANLLALSLKGLKDFAGAANIFEKIIAEYPYNSFIYNDLYECCEQIEADELLINAYKMAIENLPYEEETVIKLADLYSKVGNKEEAKKIIAKANFEHPSEALKACLSKF